VVKKIRSSLIVDDFDPTGMGLQNFLGGIFGDVAHFFLALEAVVFEMRSFYLSPGANFISGEGNDESIIQAGDFLCSFFRKNPQIETGLSNNDMCWAENPLI
jgi:hypothetical protein